MKLKATIAILFSSNYEINFYDDIENPEYGASIELEFNDVDTLKQVLPLNLLIV